MATGRLCEGRVSKSYSRKRPHVASLAVVGNLIFRLTFLSIYTIFIIWKRKILLATILNYQISLAIARSLNFFVTPKMGNVNAVSISTMCIVRIVVRFFSGDRIMKKISEWITTSTQDCGCKNQDKISYHDIGGVTDSGRITRTRIKRCFKHLIKKVVHDHDFGDYFDNFVDGQGY